MSTALLQELNQEVRRLYIAGANSRRRLSPRRRSFSSWESALPCSRDWVKG